MSKYRSGFVGIIGKPNVGKSTLMNLIIGEKIAITSYKPQTTRNRITGIKNLKGGQIIFLDTPGIHRAATPLNKYMVSAAESVFEDVDMLLFLVEAGSPLESGDRHIISTLKQRNVPVMLIINKIDKVPRETLLPLIDEMRYLHSFDEIVPVSAVKGTNVDELVSTILSKLPEGPQYFPEDMMTESSERFLAAEIIREKIMLLARQEIPYATAVIVDTFKEETERNIIRIHATINVEKNSQKGVIIGKNGSMLKKIGTQARLDMERFFGTRVFLELFVRVTQDWSQNPAMLEEFGYKLK